MRFATFCNPRVRVGVVLDGPEGDSDAVIDLPSALEYSRAVRFGESPAARGSLCNVDELNMIGVIDHWHNRVDDLAMELAPVLNADAGMQAWLRRNGVVYAIDDVRLMPPVMQPSKVVHIGSSYVDHAEKIAAARGDTTPYMPPADVKIAFLGSPSALIGHGSQIKYPLDHSSWDFEVELAIIIGRRTSSIDASSAMSSVFGYSILNDVSLRDVAPELGGPSSPRGKSRDSFLPLGPWIVSRDDITDPMSMDLRTWVNGELRQDGSTSQLAWTIAEIVAQVSHVMTLVPGDVIATGSPSGVGYDDGRFLQSGDEVAMEISGVGRLSNPVA